jgi:predicted acyl esterase
MDDDVAVPMRDGVRLATTIWRPASTGSFPVLLVRTPYGKDDIGLYGNTKAPDVFALLRAGYAVAARTFVARPARQESSSRTPRRQMTASTRSHG